MGYTPASSPGGFQIRELALGEACARVGREWHRLIEDNDFNISLTPEFVQAAAAGAGVSDRVSVLTAHEDGQLRGVLPFMVGTAEMYGLPLVMIDLAGNLLSYHHEIAAQGCELALLRACLSGRRWHVLRVEGVPDEGSTHCALHALARERASAMVLYPGGAAPHLEIRQSWSEYLAGKPGSFRYTLQRKVKALLKGGQIDERWFETPDDVPELYRCMEEIEGNSWKSAAGIAVTSRPDEGRYYQQVLPFLARNGYLFASAIYVDERPAAYQLSYRFRDRIGNLKTSFDEAYRTLSPGAVVLQKAIQRAFETSAREFDFLGDVQHHKLLWTQQVRTYATHFVFSRRPLGAAIGAVKRLAQTCRHQAFRHVMQRSSGAKGVEAE